MAAPQRRLEHIASALSVAPTAGSSSGRDFFGGVTVAPPDEVFHVAAAYKADTDPSKVDLGIGAYRDDNGRPAVLSVVRKAEARILSDPSLNKEYGAIDGDAKFVKYARALLFGNDCTAVKEGRAASAQGLSGTGSLRLGLEFIAKFLPKGTTVYISKPTWGNHMALASHALAGLAWKQYRYWDARGRELDLDGMLEDLRAAPAGSVVLLHACAHNPTGVDPTHEQWKAIAGVIRERGHLPFFDSAYQGFATGSLDGDAWAVRYFTEQGFQLIAAQSFAKNMGMYGERIGLVTLITGSAAQTAAVLSQLKILIRSNYSNPPLHGARVVGTILSDPALFAEWVEELKAMSGRIIAMRKALRDEIERLGTPGDWSHVTTQIGMFSFTGLTAPQCELLTKKYHVYLLKNGRISVAGLNSKNVKHVAAAIADAVKNA